jgi:UDP-2,4-diacetamido-2,4,6-trideoxy-beta-L-altropyranose hydrolase
MKVNNSAKRVAIRVDANRKIGTGHFMRCVTLANALVKYGIVTVFFSRDLDVSLQDILVKNNHELLKLVDSPVCNSVLIEDNAAKTTYSDWLTVSQRSDADECIEEFKKSSWLCVIVDHYGIDWTWESKVKLHISDIIVIDDLADRRHMCRLLLDQNLGREALDYSGLVPSDCILLLGPSYALLRPEFFKLRSMRTRTKKNTNCLNILISMGGVDIDNYTQRILAILDRCKLADGTRIVVILGKSSPWIDEISKFSRNYNHDIEVLVGVDNMAAKMFEADVAFGAAGATSWERCCMGLPTLCFMIAENQRMGSIELEKRGAIIAMDIDACSPDILQSTLDNLKVTEIYDSMKSSCLKIVDGNGLPRVMMALSDLISEFPNICNETLPR